MELVWLIKWKQKQCFKAVLIIIISPSSLLKVNLTKNHTNNTLI